MARVHCAAAARHQLWFMTDVLLPVEAPIQPAASDALSDDPVLTSPRHDEPYVTR